MGCLMRTLGLRCNASRYMTRRRLVSASSGYTRPTCSGSKVWLHCGAWTYQSPTGSSSQSAALLGGGKTSLLNLIGTIDTPTRGSVGVCGTAITERTEDHQLAEIRLHSIGFVFQAFNLLPNLTALENVEVPMRLAGKLSAQDRRCRALELLHKVGLEERAGHTPAQLSGGEQQRVTIARSLANSPTLLLLDEPTGDLDSRNSDIVMNILVELNTEGMAIVMVTHDMALKHFAHRVINLYDGKVSHVEAVSPDTRQEAIRELVRVCVQHQQTDDEDEPVEADASSASTEIVTEYRTRLNYPACL